MAMYAGQGVGLIKEILPAGEVVRKLVEGAQHLIQTHLSSFVHKDWCSELQYFLFPERNKFKNPYVDVDECLKNWASQVK